MFKTLNFTSIHSNYQTMKFSLVFTFTLFSYYLCAQPVLPPPALEPTAQDKILIDSLVSVSNFDVYFKEHCTIRIQHTGYERGWSAAEIAERIGRIDFNDFMEYTVYNSFASLTKKELTTIIELMRKLNKDDYVFTSGMI
jgi:hypothetical protein